MNVFSKTFTQVLSLLSLLLCISASVLAAHNHAAMEKQDKNTCEGIDITCAKTVTSAFAPNGDLWRVWAADSAIYYQISLDKGTTFAQAKQVNIPAEKISARNENRPKIAFDNANGVYLSWASPLSQKYTANVRFAYSNDYGKSFSAPITVNNDNLLAGHSFNEMHVSKKGEVSIVWLDGRKSYALHKQGKPANGSALYLAQANFSNNTSSSFTNEELADGTCQCCRIAMDENKSGNLAILWRHIFGDNIREFAMITLNEKPKIQQYSQDYWHIAGCPHQGGGISVDDNNTYHTVWFNQGEKGKGIFYAQTDDMGATHSIPLSIGELSKQAAYGNVMSNGNIVDIVWTQFNGIEHTLWHQRSTNYGQSFGKAIALQIAKHGIDRPFIIKHNKVNYVSWQRPNQGHWIKAL
ncbi:hypothetical protein [Colwellia sp. UCD-KL20]|uniref:hypothetical protein n=1 Tax=Colwellia sp. UCD-KL20 TaxID=1917165 RepID=UPI000970BF03|nr:hypothetical protein [Colwellia sp. UCD-KL20]